MACRNHTYLGHAINCTASCMGCMQSWLVSTHLLRLGQGPVEQPLSVALDVGRCVAARDDRHAPLHVPPQQHLPYAHSPQPHNACCKKLSGRSTMPSRITYLACYKQRCTKRFAWKDPNHVRSLVHDMPHRPHTRAATAVAALRSRRPQRHSAWLHWQCTAYLPFLSRSKGSMPARAGGLSPPPPSEPGAASAGRRCPGPAGSTRRNAAPGAHGSAVSAQHARLHNCFGSATMNTSRKDRLQEPSCKNKPICVM